MHSYIESLTLYAIKTKCTAMSHLYDFWANLVGLFRVAEQAYIFYMVLIVVEKWVTALTLAF